ncbi:hypothetical protein NMD1_00141 [Novosphingobium sp. MD-1]|nr:hypothetical protein NMD1_00141 [Novosphingobium sp. MD-1]
MILAVEEKPAGSGAIWGVYESTTGSTGRYLVTGRRGGTACGEKGQPLALAIAWRSVGGDPADPSWHWASAMAGQYHGQDGGAQVTVNHLLVASGEFPGLCGPGLYCDKLTYRRTSDTPYAGLPPAGVAVPHPASGVWSGADGMRLALRVLAEPGGRVALVDGFLEQDGREIAITGFADLDGQAEESDRCALAITAYDEARNRTVAMGGWLEGEAGALLLQALTGHATPLDGAYLQTSLWPLSLVRRDGP